VDVSKLETLGWRPRVSLDEGLKLAYRDFCETRGRAKGEEVSAPA
jgi:nucleoside-diphosphate-sugar epimerase